MSSNDDLLNEIKDFCLKVKSNESDYELIVEKRENLDAVFSKLKEHGLDFVVRSSYLNRRKKGNEKHRLFWKTKGIADFGKPFVIENVIRKECVLGQKRKIKSVNDDHPCGKQKRLHLRPLKKNNCPAVMKIIEITYYPGPEFTMSEFASCDITRTKAKKLKALSSALQDENQVILQEKRFYVTFSKDSIHNHSLSSCFLNQQLDSKVKNEIIKYVNDGITHIQTIQQLLRNYVKNNISDKIPTSSRSFYPTKKILYNYVLKHIYQTKASTTVEVPSANVSVDNESVEHNASVEGNSMVIPSTNVLDPSKISVSREKLIKKIKKQAKILHDSCFLISASSSPKNLKLLSEKFVEVQNLVNSFI